MKTILVQLGKQNYSRCFKQRKINTKNWLSKREIKKLATAGSNY